MAKKNDKGKQPGKPQPQPEHEDFLEIINEPDQIVDQPAPVDVFAEPEGVDLIDDDLLESAGRGGAPGHGAEAIEVDEPKLVLDEPAKPAAPRPARPAPPPPGARVRQQPKSAEQSDHDLGKLSVPPVKRGAPTQMAPAKGAQPTQLAPAKTAPSTQLAPAKTAQPTQLAPAKSAQPTQLAPADELAQDLPEEGGKGKATRLAPKQAQPTQLAPKQPQPTQLAPEKTAPLTQLAPPKMAPATHLAPEKTAPLTHLAPAKTAKPTQLTQKPGVPTQLVPPGESPIGEDEPLVPRGESEAMDLIDEGLLGRDSAVNLDRAGSEVPSGVDLIAEQLESQVGSGRRSGRRAGDEDALGHDAARGIESSAVDLGSDTGRPFEISEDLLVTDEHEPTARKRAGDQDRTQPYQLEGEGKGGNEEAVVIDESLLVDEAARAEHEEVRVDDLIGMEEPADKGAKKRKKARAEEEAEEEGGVAVATKAKAKAKKRRARDEEEDEEMLRPVRRRRPRYGRRWLGGMILGLLIAVGALLAVRSFQPDLWVEMQEKLDEYIPSPDAKPKPKGPQGPIATPAQLALDKMNKGDLDGALTLVRDASPKDKDKLAVKGQVEWLIYYKGKTNKREPLSKDDPAAQTALKDLEAADKKLLLDQVLDTIAKSELEKDNVRATQSESALKLLLKTKNLIDDKTDPKTVDTTKIVGKLIVDNENQAAAVEKLQGKVDDLNKEQERLVEITKNVKNLLINEKVFKAGDELLEKDLPKSVAKALMERKNLSDILDQLGEKLAAASIKEKDHVKGVEALASARDKLQKDLSELQKAAEEAYKTISEGKPLPAGADLKKHLVEHASIISLKAQAPLVHSLGRVVNVVGNMSNDAALWLKAAVERTAAETRLKFYEAREPLIDTPEKKVDTWLALFREHGFRNAAELEKARKDALWVGSVEAKAAPEVRAKALYLQALMARNQEQFDQSRKLLGEALALAGALPKQPAWKDAAAHDLLELTDAKAYYLPAARKLAAQPGQLSAAVKQLDLGLKAIANDPDLMLEQARVLLQMWPAEGKPEPALSALIRKDAEAALKNPATAAEANFVLGQVEEKLGALPKAMSYYGQALSAAKGDKDAADRYQRAVGHLLLLDSTLTPAVPTAPAVEGKDASRLGDDRTDAPGAFAPLVTVALLAINMQDLGGGVVDPAEAKREAQLKKLLDVAEKFKKSADPKVQGQGFMIYGLAISEQGKRTEGLKAYVNGLKLYYPGIESDKLKTLVDLHPAFFAPDVLTQPNPALAESHFGNGVHLYFEGKYPQAEGQFLKAIFYHKNDARYHYFLGLARHAQKSQSKEILAEHSIKAGAFLEIQDLPTSREINLSLERVQGPLRQYLNGIKARARLGE